MSDSIVPEPFTIAVADSPAGATLLVVTGEMDVATSSRFRAHVEAAIAAGSETLIVDLTEVTFIESTMLRELLRAREDFDGSGAGLMIVGAGAPVLRLLDLTGTTRLFSLAATRDEALAAAGH